MNKPVTDGYLSWFQVFNIKMNRASFKKGCFFFLQNFFLPQLQKLFTEMNNSEMESPHSNRY